MCTDEDEAYRNVFKLMTLFVALLVALEQLLVDPG